MSEFEPSLPVEPEPVARRAARAAESILENESLTGDLDDATARLLLDWGVACAQAIAADTAGLDDAQAGEAMAPRLRAVRQTLRAVSRWVAERQDMTPADSDARLAQVIERAAPIYGPRFAPPTEEQRAAFLRQQFDDAPAMVAALRGLLEGWGDASPVEDATSAALPFEPESVHTGGIWCTEV